MWNSFGGLDGCLDDMSKTRETEDKISHQTSWITVSQFKYNVCIVFWYPCLVLMMLMVLPVSQVTSEKQLGHW